MRFKITDMKYFYNLNTDISVSVSDIVQFAEIPDGGHYEYMQPAKYLLRNSTNNNKKHNYTQLQRSSCDNPEMPPRRSSNPCAEALPPRPPARHTSAVGQHSDSRSKYRQPEKTRLPPVRPVSPTLASVRDIKHVSHIPENLDLKGLSVEDVAHC